MSIERVLTGETSKKMIGPELGKDPLPVEKGPFDFVWKIWSVIGVWPLSLPSAGRVCPLLTMAGSLTTTRHGTLHEDDWTPCG
jgi:hypothetical protein